LPVKPLARFLLSGAKKRQLQPERYMPFVLNWSKNIDKRIFV
jgi:hypothetical protein